MAKSLRKSRLSSALDLGVAALAAVAAGFAFFAMPEGLFASIVVKSGLPKVLAAAQPPLGGTARLAAVAAAGLLVFAFVWSLLRALEGSPAKPSVAAEEEDQEDEAPQGEVLRLRKADIHPDAPARRPIQAGRELGEPFAPDILELETLAEPEAEPTCQAEPEPETQPEPEPAPEPAPEPEPEPEPAPAVELQPVPGFLVAQAIPPEAEAEPEPDSEPAPGDSADLSKLMERFESGLTRKQQAIVRAVPPPEPPASAAPASEAAPQEPSDRVGHRLRSAIAELQKVSGRGG